MSDSNFESCFFNLLLHRPVKVNGTYKIGLLIFSDGVEATVKYNFDKRWPIYVSMKFKGYPFFFSNDLKKTRDLCASQNMRSKSCKL